MAIVSTTAMVKYVGEITGYEYAASISTLESWARGLRPNPYAQRAARLLSAKRARHGGSHFTIGRSGYIVSAERA